jgi:hypothetical protein
MTIAVLADDGSYTRFQHTCSLGKRVIWRLRNRNFEVIAGQAKDNTVGVYLTGSSGPLTIEDALELATVIQRAAQAAEQLAQGVPVHEIDV